MKYRKLLEPGKIGQLELSNRLVVAPMGMNFATPDGCVTERMKAYHEERARGGASLIILGMVAVDAPRGKSLDYQLSVSSDDCIPGLVGLAHIVHRYGAKVAMQLAHAGKLSLVDMAAGISPAAPSKTGLAMRESMRGLTRDELARRMKRFASMPLNLTTRELSREEIKRLGLEQCVKVLDEV